MTKNKINAEIILDSVNEYGVRLTSFILTYPRFILAELNTHRMLSRNTASCLSQDTTIACMDDLTNDIHRIKISDLCLYRNYQYVKSFSLEWSWHQKTQLDSVNHIKSSKEAFQKRIDMPLSGLRGKLVLDAGCGMGRYMEVMADHGAEVIGVDLSFSVDSAFNNIGKRENVHLLQGDLFQLPFKEEQFDFIYSYGVLHHTPSAEKAFYRLPPLLKKGGKVSIFVYSSYNKPIVYSSSFWRAITRKLPKRLLYYCCSISIPLYYLYKIPVIGHLLKGIFVISMEKNWHWRWLDTFDWYSPQYQSKHTHAEVFQWFERAGLHKVAIFEEEVTMSAEKPELSKRAPKIATYVG